MSIKAIHDKIKIELEKKIKDEGIILQTKKEMKNKSINNVEQNITESPEKQPPESKSKT